MKFGMPTLLECKDLFALCEKTAEFGLDFLEINMTFPGYIPADIDSTALRNEGERLGIFFTIHADEMLNPFDFNPLVSECYFGVMRDTISFAKAVNAPIINMHLLRGVYVTLPDRVAMLNDCYSDVYLSRVRSFIEMCESEIGQSNIKIAIENTDGFTQSQLDALKLFMKSSVFGLTMDCGHLHCVNYTDLPVYNQYANKLLHMHLHDAKGTHAHLPLGLGDIDIPEKISRLNNDKTCLVEVKTLDGLDSSLDYLRERDYV